MAKAYAPSGDELFLYGLCLNDQPADLLLQVIVALVLPGRLRGDTLAALLDRIAAIRAERRAAG